MIVGDLAAVKVHPATPDLWAIAKRRRYAIVLPVLASLSVSILGYANAPPAYVSEAVLVLDTRRLQAMPSESVISPLPQDSPALRTQLDVIGSRMMAESVVGLLQREGIIIAPPAPDRRLLSKLMKTIRDWLSPASRVNAPDDEAPVADTLDQRAKIDLLLSDLRVSNDGRSFTIYISYRAPDPVLAAQVANAFAKAYLEHQIEVHRSATHRVSNWLGETLESLRVELETSESALEDFLQQAGLVETNGVTLQAQRVAASNAELAAARAARAAAQARVDTVRKLAEAENIPALAEILGSTTIQSLRAELARVERTLQGLRGSGALKSRQIGPLTSELTTLKQQIAEEVARVVESLANEAAIAAQKEEGLEETLRQAQIELSKANHAEVKAAQLQREANANKTIYESYLVRYKQTIEQDGMAAPEAQLISPAEPAMARAQPRLMNWLLLGLGLGSGLAAAMVVVREATDRRPRFIQDLQAATGVPVVGCIPLLSRRELMEEDRDAADPSTRFGNALAAIRIALQFEQNSALLLTSASARAGKTTTALGIARAAAAAGLKVALVDANSRSPAVAKAAGLHPIAFLDEIQVPARKYSDLLTKDTASNVRIIAGHPGNTAPESLLAGKAFSSLIADLKANFDLVLIDTPALDQAPDALHASRTADHIVLVVRNGRHASQMAAEAIRQLTMCGHPPDGIVVNQADHGIRHALSGQHMLAGVHREAVKRGSRARPVEPIAAIGLKGRRNAVREA